MSGATGTGYEARLLEDRGAAASDEAEFFRCPAFLEAEGVTHSLVIEGGGGSLVAPLVVREIPEGGIDASSPYGYPGFGLAGEASGLPIDPKAVEFGPTGLVSAQTLRRVVLRLMLYRPRGERQTLPAALSARFGK